MKYIYCSLLLGLLISLPVDAQKLKRDTLLSGVPVRVGYTHADQNVLSGAVDQVTGERMKKGLVTSSLEALSGQSAGVQVTGGSNQEAMVTAVRVRGTTSLTGGNDPLVLIDGVTADLATLSTIYPADIENFTILKDASETAQYAVQRVSFR